MKLLHACFGNVIRHNSLLQIYCSGYQTIINSDTSEEVFIFGFHKEQKLPKPLNFILLYAKYFIYLSRSKITASEPECIYNQTQIHV